VECVLVPSTVQRFVVHVSEPVLSCCCCCYLQVSRCTRCPTGLVTLGTGSNDRFDCSEWLVLCPDSSGLHQYEFWLRMPGGHEPCSTCTHITTIVPATNWVLVVDSVDTSTNTCEHTQPC
jgi:hypothetical protein